ncbi:hypothetical protein CDD80_970 [Ophiocordyceps camponoti-rufipedis]|uniref:Dihydrolipoamide acetyltransferase component of pyruvate dehydrogenase complex n=1 Tax=Ophiocordyceps camponoti-rufipedis TaxID=2004952 RepID=A0A2C5ZAL8_9HYPO|nr:hypothetical protein CDD80_970 [Ophiocordyceps camponoti-rufipedis]
MPALSPTMTEGNIASWKVKDGQTYSAGDVLLEIETDKATMDVEAQEDGVMMKILSGDGSKAVQVGKRIAVIADAGDDVAALEMPADEQPSPSAKQEKSNDSSASPPRETSSSSKAERNEAVEQKYPLMPAVEHLVRQHGLAEDDVRRIKPTGPNGRLLKGDVLAFLGTIKPEAPSSISDRFATLSRLDLSGIKVAATKPKDQAKASSQDTPAKTPPPPPPLEINIPVSLTNVLEMQKRIRTTLGVAMPLSTFVHRAANMVNDQLPPATRSQADLFDQILGLDKAKRSRRAYEPELASAPLPAAPRAEKVAFDIIDELAGSARRPVQIKHVAQPLPSEDASFLKLVVAKEEGQRARAFLERCKWFLETDPGRLVLSQDGSL